MTTPPSDIAGLVSLVSDQLDDLDSRGEGLLLRTEDVGWDDALLVWNGMVTTIPALVVQPTSAHDMRLSRTGKA